MATRRRTTVRRRNPANLTALRSMLAQADDGLMFALDEISNVTVWGVDTATKTELTKFRKAHKEVSKALLAVHAAQSTLK